MLKNGENLQSKVSEKLNLFFTFKKFTTVLTYAFAAIVAIQFLGICYFNIFQLEEHLGFDASSGLLRARMMWEQKTLFPVMYVEQTSLMLGGSEIFAALLYGITKNICLSFGIANIIHTAVNIVVLGLIFKQLKMSRLATLVGLSLFLIPFVVPPYNTSNPLGYFFCMFFDCGFSTLSTLSFLITYYVYIKLIKNEKFTIKTKVLTVFLFVLYGLNSISSGISLILYVVAPILLYEFINVISKADFSVILNKRLLFIIGATATIFLGKIITVTFISFESRESAIKLIGISKFWDNFFNIFLGLAKLMGAGSIESSATVFSYIGIVHLINTLITVIFVFAVVFSIWKICKPTKTDAEKTQSDECKESEGTAVTIKERALCREGLCYLVTVFLVNFFIYALLDTIDGSAIFEERYLILSYTVGVILVGYFIDNFSVESFYRVCITALAVAVLLSSLASYKALNDGKASISSELVEACQKYDTKVVYGYDTEDLDIYIRNMRILDADKVYKVITESGVIYHWGDYQYYDDVSDYTGGVLFIVQSGRYDSVPEQYKPLFEYKETVNGYDFYTSTYNPFDFATALPDEGKTIDFPYTLGMYTENMTVASNGAYQTNGTEGCCMWGPYTPVKAGVFKFTLFYDVITSDSAVVGKFELNLNGTTSIAEADVNAGVSSVTIEVQLPESGELEYKFFNAENSIVQLHRIEIEKVS